MGVVLDSTVLVEAERKGFDIEAFLAARGDEPVALAAITASELLRGVERATSAAIRERRSRFVEAVLDAFPPITFSLAEARVHARIWAALRRKGTPIGAHDLLVAATATSLGYEVATLNTREFKQIPGLVLSDLRDYTNAQELGEPV